MNRRGRSRFGGSPEIYYYNSARRDAVGELAGQLSGLIQEEMTRRHKKKLVFLCIGTDRSTGDSLGPLIGYKLKQERRRGTLVFGTLDRPVHCDEPGTLRAGFKKWLPGCTGGGGRCLGWR